MEAEDSGGRNCKPLWVLGVNERKPLEKLLFDLLFWLLNMWTDVRICGFRSTFGGID